MAKIIAIDPGAQNSAWIQYDTESGPDIFAFEDNEAVVSMLATRAVYVKTLAIEQIQHYGTGMPAGMSVHDTSRWIGIFQQEFGRKRSVLIPRPTIKACLCGSARAKDSNVRQALIDRFGGSKAEAIGLKKSPGPLYGISGHVWSALAVAVCWQEMQDQARRALRPPPWSKPG